MTVEWDPLIIAAILAVLTFAVYKHTKAARITGLFTAATVLFAGASVRSLMIAAHHPVNSGPAIAIIIVGAIASGVACWLVMARGHHVKPFFKRKGATTTAKSEKAPHHRAMVTTVAAMVFGVLLAFNFQGAMNAGRGGVSQTYSEITH